MYTPKTETIELFGYKLQLCERKAVDVNKMLLFSSQSSEKNYFSYLFQNAVVIADALSINLKKLKWYQFWKRYQFKKLLSYKNLVDKLSQDQLTKLAEKVYQLEGLDSAESKKKVKTETENQ